jgi:60 kDa SS-A/Ro ribonucleoprotein
MRSNAKAVNTARTHGGAVAAPKIEAVHQLERLVSTCLLFERSFYESGDETAKNIADQCKKVDPIEIARMAVRARTEFSLRHVPLFLVAQLDLNRNKLKESDRHLIADTVFQVVRRADELAELLSVIQKVNGNKPLKKCISAQVKKGLARAFGKFNEYTLAKYNRDNAIKLRDVLFLVHRKPAAEGRSKLVSRQYEDGNEGQVRRHSKGEGLVLKQLVEGTLPTPDTWEVRLSSGADKKKSWVELLEENKLGPMALIRNVRNMEQAGVPATPVAQAISRIRPGSGILPFQFLSALRNSTYGTKVNDALDRAMTASLEGRAILPGKTVLLIDVSGSMEGKLSKGESSRIDAASALAILLREVCEDFNLVTFSSSTIVIGRPQRGFALSEQISKSQPHSSTQLFQALADVNRHFKSYDRLLVITDEQATDSPFRGGSMPAPLSRNAYIVNVAHYKPGLDTSGGYKRINSFSERLTDFIRFEEGLNGDAAQEEE